MAEDFLFVAVVVGVATQRKQRHTVVAAEKTVGHIVDSIGDRHCNLAEQLREQLTAVQMLGNLGNRLLANHEADLPYHHAAGAAGMPNFLSLLGRLVSFRATTLLR